MAPERWSDPPRLPLIDPCDGVCEAEASLWTPDEAALKQYCNTGYARGRCPRFPAAAPYDAVRFTAGEDGEVRYVFEKNYSPAGHGVTPADGGRLAAQAAVFANAWTRRPRKERKS